MGKGGRLSGLVVAAALLGCRAGIGQDGRAEKGDGPANVARGCGVEGKIDDCELCRAIGAVGKDAGKIEASMRDSDKLAQEKIDAWLKDTLNAGGETEYETTMEYRHYDPGNEAPVWDRFAKQGWAFPEGKKTYVRWDIVVAKRLAEHWVIVGIVEVEVLEENSKVFEERSDATVVLRRDATRDGLDQWREYADLASHLNVPLHLMVPDGGAAKATLDAVEGEAADPILSWLLKRHEGRKSYDPLRLGVWSWRGSGDEERRR